MKPTPLALVAPPDDWAQVERWSVRAQALAELRALSERETTPEATVRSIRLP